MWMLSAGVHGSARLADGQAAVFRPDVLPAGDGAPVVAARCLGCHAVDLIAQQRLSRAGWSQEVDKMIRWGAMVDSSERDQLEEYLEMQFGPRTLPQARAPGHPGAAVVAMRCLICHDARLIEQQRLTAAGWTSEVAKMVSWGATLTEPEKAALIAYLAGSPSASELSSPR
jgi:hypothetical protein